MRTCIHTCCLLIYFPYLYICLCVYIYLHIHIYLPVCLYLSTYSHIYLPICLYVSIYLFIHMSTCLSICIYPPIHIHLPVCLSVSIHSLYLSIYQPIIYYSHIYIQIFANTYVYASVRMHIFTQEKNTRNIYIIFLHDNVPNRSSAFNPQHSTKTTSHLHPTTQEAKTPPSRHHRTSPFTLNPQLHTGTSNLELPPPAAPTDHQERQVVSLEGEFLYTFRRTDMKQFVLTPFRCKGKI